NVDYVKGLPTLPQIGRIARQVWPEILGTRKPLVLLNNVWSALPEFRSDILSLAKHRHVIVADQQISLPKPDFKPEYSIRTLSVASAKENFNWIAVRIQ